MLVIRSKCMLEKQAEGLRRSTGALPVHGCASDSLASLIQSRVSVASVVEAVMGSLPWLRVAQESPRCCQSPRCWNHAGPKDSFARQWRWKFSAIAAFCGCPSFPLSSPSVLFSLFFFFSLDSGSLSVTSSSFLVLLLFLLLFRNYVEGRRAGGWGSCLRGRGGSENREGERGCLRSSVRSSLVHSKIWHPLLICSSKNPSGEECWRKKRNQSTYRQALKMWALKAGDSQRCWF